MRNWISSYHDLPCIWIAEGNLCLEKNDQEPKKREQCDVLWTSSSIRECDAGWYDKQGLLLVWRLGANKAKVMLLMQLVVTLQARSVQEELANAEHPLSMACNLVQVVYIALPQRQPVHSKYETQICKWSRIMVYKYSNNSASAIFTWYKCFKSIVSLITGSTRLGSFDRSVSWGMACENWL